MSGIAQRRDAACRGIRDKKRACSFVELRANSTVFDEGAAAG
jgi:hypothetical protein